MKNVLGTKPRKPRDRSRVYSWAYDQDLSGAIEDEIQAALGMTHQTCSARVSDLKKDRLLIPNGKTRKTRSGYDADVLIARGVLRKHGLL